MIAFIDEFRPGSEKRVALELKSPDAAHALARRESLCQHLDGELEKAKNKSNELRNALDKLCSLAATLVVRPYYDEWTNAVTNAQKVLEQP